jgi:hypothetical protein
VVIGNEIDWLTVSGVQLYSVVIVNGIDWLTVSGVQLYSVVIGNGIDWLQMPLFTSRLPCRCHCLPLGYPADAIVYL